MNLSSLSIQRPVLSIVLSLVILLFGLIGFYFIGVREYPSVDPPIISVTTNYAGANSNVIESQITEPLEESINGIAGISSISSTSSEGRSNITIEFDLGIDLEAAANDVRDRVSRAIRRLPPDIDVPIVTKSDASSMPILTLTLQSDSRTLLELSDYANNVFKERLQTIKGISEINIWGEKKYAMRLMIDPQKLSFYNLNVIDIKNALDKENVELPSGRIEGYNSELIIKTFGRLQTEDDFNNLIIKENNGIVVKLKDVGRAVLSAENEKTLLRGNGNIPMVGIAVTPQPGSNYIAIADEFYKRVKILKKELPPDLKIGWALDTTKNIRRAITEVEETLVIAFLLVILVIFLFLRRWRTTLIPIIAIPISLIGTFFVMYVADFSINILTLLAIVLATGLVVDDAIVVMENIYKKIEEGESPIEAAHKGSKEVFFAIISTTITLVAVFIPIVFMQGLTGRLFKEFGIIVASAVVISAFVSLSLTPMICSKIIKNTGNKKNNKFYTITERFFNQLNTVYEISLRKFMRYRYIAIVIMALSFVLIIIAGSNLKSELAPIEDKSFLRLSSTAPEGTSYEQMYDYMNLITEIIDTLPEKEAIVSVTSPTFFTSAVNFGTMRIALVEPSKRQRSQEELANYLNDIFKKYSLARTFVSQEQTISIGRGSGMPVQYVIQANNFENLKEKLPIFLDKAYSDPTFQIVDVDLKFNKPEINIKIDREKAGATGVNVMDIAMTLQILYSDQRMGYFLINNKQYQVIGQAERSYRASPIDLKSIFVKNNKNQMIQLDNLVKIENNVNPPQLYRFNRHISATVSAIPSQGKTLGDGIKAMDKIKESTLDENFSTSLNGPSKDFAQSSNSLMFAFMLALILTFLVLAAQFESFTDPLTIMFTVPLAIAGALISLWIFGHTLNIFSQIGIIILIGIVTKNGILIVEFANQIKDKGVNKTEAAIQAATIRLRPILMTSLATILGAMPIALAIGASATSRIPMGIVIIGGLIFSLILTLYIIPALYSLLSKENKTI